MLKRSIFWIAGTLALAVELAAVQPARVSVDVGDPRFVELAQEVIEEIERLLGPPGDAWLLAGPASGGTEATAGTPSESGEIQVLVGPRPTSGDRAEAPGDSIEVDVVGWLEASPTGVSRGPLVETVARDLRQLRDLLDSLGRSPDGGEILVLSDSWLEPARKTIEEVASSLGVEVRWAELGAVNSLTGERRPVAVYVLPGSSLDAAELARSLVDAGVVGFSSRGRRDVEAGLLAGPSPDHQKRLARLAALQVLARIRGLEEGSEAVRSKHHVETEDLETHRLALNLSTASALGIELPWRLRLASDWIGDAAGGDGLTIDAARLEASKANLALRAADLRTASSEEEIQIALSQLRPRFTVGADVSVQDRESAEASFGVRPERLGTAVGEASWILFSEPARAAVDVTRRLQAARRLELRELELDLELDAVTLLLDLAGAYAAEAIERQTLDLTYAELDAAWSRRRAGSGGRAEVARLEARAASDRRALVVAYGARRATELTLNRLLARPLDGQIRPLVSPPGSAQALPFQETIARPTELDELRRQLLERGRRLAPEISAAGEIVMARERELQAARRALLWPVIQGSASLVVRLDEGGEGIDPPTFPFAGGGFPETPSSAWNLGLTARWSPFTGGRRVARRTQARLELEAAQVLAARAEQRVEERVRRALLAVETSYEIAHQARMAVRAARVAYEVVADGYERGIESLTALFDAQTTLRSARLASAAADESALARWYEAQRASGGFFDRAPWGAFEGSPGVPPASPSFESLTNPSMGAPTAALEDGR